MGNKLEKILIPCGIAVAGLGVGGTTSAIITKNVVEEQVNEEVVNNPVELSVVDNFLYVNGEKTEYKVEDNKANWYKGNGSNITVEGKNGDLYFDIDSGDIYELKDGNWEYTGTSKIKDSQEMTYIKKLNSLIHVDHNAHNTYHSVIEALKKRNITANELEAKNVLWDSVNDYFVFESDSKIIYEDNVSDLIEKLNVNDSRLWKVVSSEVKKENQVYSLYWNSNNQFNEPLTVGFDAGYCDAIDTLKYIGSNKAKEVVIRTNGSDLTIESPLDTVYHYGVADDVVIKKVANDTYYELGNANGIDLYSGHIVLDKNSDVGSLFLKSTDSDFDNIHISLENNVELPRLICDSIGNNLEEDVLIFELTSNNDSEFIYFKSNTPVEETVVKTSTGEIIGNPSKNASIATNYLSFVSDSNYLAVVNDNSYETLASAFAAATDNDVIYLYDFKKADTLTVLDESQILVDKNVTLKGLNDPTFRIPNTLSLFNVKSGYNFTLDGINFDGGVRFDRTENKQNSTIDTIYDVEDKDNTELANLVRNTNNGSFIFVNSNSTLKVNDCSFTGFYQSNPTLNDTQYQNSIIFARGLADNKANVLIENTTFANNAGLSGVLLLQDQYVDATLNNCKIVDNVSVRNSNHGLFKVYVHSNLTFNNSLLEGNSYNGNGGLVGIYNNSVVTLNDSTIKNNYGGYFETSHYESKAFNNGRLGMFYIHNTSALVSNGSVFTDNHIYGLKASTGYDDDAGAVASNYPVGHYILVYGIIDVQESSVAKLGDGRYSLTLNNTIMKDNYYHFTDNKKIETTFASWVRDFAETNRQYIYKVNDNCDLHGYYGDICVYTSNGEKLEDRNGIIVDDD